MYNTGKILRKRRGPWRRAEGAMRTSKNVKEDNGTERGGTYGRL